jgi:hypothetical protein
MPMGAQADFQSGIDAFEAQHRTIDSPESRISHFDESWDVFGDMIRLQLQQRKRPESALAYVERSRAQTLLGSVMRPADWSNAAPSLSNLQHRIPRNVAVLSFATLTDVLATWIITDHSVDVVQQPVALAVLEAKTAALRTALVSGTDRQQRDLLTDLYDLLIRRVAARIDAGGDGPRDCPRRTVEQRSVFGAHRSPDQSIPDRRPGDWHCAQRGHLR